MSVFDEFRAHASLPFEQARMLPLEAYASAEVLDAELATVFTVDWQCVARTADLGEVGDYVCADLPVAGGGVRSIAVIRSEDSIRPSTMSASTAAPNCSTGAATSPVSPARTTPGCTATTVRSWVVRTWRRAPRRTVNPSAPIVIVCLRCDSRCGTASCS